MIYAAPSLLEGVSQRHFSLGIFFFPSSNTHLEVLPGDHLLGEEAIDEVVREKEGFGHKLELEVHLNEPVDEDGAHLIVDVRLDEHVVGRNLGVRL